jgi:circadian clock protein KaiB
MRAPVKSGPVYKFLLYVAEGTQNSALATANLTSLCRNHLENRHEIEIVDVFEKPKRALADRVFMTPTLVVMAPAPVQRIIGNLSQTTALMSALGIQAHAA